MKNAYPLRTLLSLAFIVINLFVTVPVDAQKKNASMYILTSATEGMAFVKINQQRLTGENEQTHVKVKSSDLDVYFNPQVSKYLNKQIVAQMYQSDFDVAIAFEGVNIVEYFKNNIKEWDLDPNNLADILTAYILRAWQAANTTYKPTYQQVLAVSEQTRRAIRQSESIANLSSKNRQELAESFIYHSMLIYSMYGTATQQGDEMELQHLSAQICAMFNNSGIDLKQMDLTDSGFIASNIR